MNEMPSQETFLHEGQLSLARSMLSIFSSGYIFKRTSNHGSSHTFDLAVVNGSRKAGSDLSLNHNELLCRNLGFIPKPDDGKVNGVQVSVKDISTEEIYDWAYVLLLIHKVVFFLGSVICYKRQGSDFDFPHFLALLMDSMEANNDFVAINSKFQMLSYVQNISVKHRNVLNSMPEESKLTMEQSELAEGFIRSAISVHQNRNPRRKYHKLTDPFPHTADPPIRQYIFALESPLLYKAISDYSFTSNFPTRKQKQKNSTLEIATQVLAYTQIVYEAIVRAHIAALALQIILLMVGFTYAKGRLSSAGFDMEEPPIVYDDWIHSPLPATTFDEPTPVTEYTEASPDISLFDHIPSPATTFDEPTPITEYTEASPDISLFDNISLSSDQVPYFVTDFLILDCPGDCRIVEDAPVHPCADAGFTAPMQQNAHILSRAASAAEPTLFAEAERPPTPIVTSDASASVITPVATPDADPLPPTSLQCQHPNCSKRGFKRPCDLRKHQKTHDKNLFCKYNDTCKKGFSSKKDKRRHEETVHEKKRSHVCPVCRERKSRKDNLKDHIRRIHPQQNLSPSCNPKVTNSNES